MSVILLIGGLLLFCFCLTFRTVLLHPFSFVFYAFKDLFLYFKHHDYDLCPTGKLNEYNAHFGGGKTMSAVHDVSSLYYRYNNKKVWDRDQKRFVIQKIHVISNVDFLNFSSDKLESLAQVTNLTLKYKNIDKENGTRTVIILMLDEASVQLNSRNFKTNISADFLNSLLCSRHYNMNIYITSQKHRLVDALMRSVTQTCISCHKVWRIMINTYYDADEIEYASNPTLVKPICRKAWFIKDKDYNAYDTLAVVDNLKKSVDEGDMLSEAEILALRGVINPDNDAVTSPSRKLRRMRKK